MKSGGPVSTRQKPSLPAFRGGKAHFRPSHNQSLSTRKKQTTLSPVRPEQRSGPQLHAPSPESQQLFEKQDYLSYTADDQPVFAESWPSTECGSSPSSTTTSSDMDKHKQSAGAGKFNVSSDVGDQQDSVLSKYIERFRHGRPRSREERQQTVSAIGEKQQPFWWMSSSDLPLSSTPTKTTDKDDHGPALYKSLSPCRGSRSILLDTYQGELDDTDILLLQERANRLLLREYKNHDGALGDASVLVSSDGLESSDFSTPVSVDEPIRRTFNPSLAKSTTVKSRPDSVQAWSSVVPSLAPPTRPEEDILFQWRLRRKMEQAREGPRATQNAHTFSWEAPGSNHALAAEQAYKQQQHIQPPELPQMARHPHNMAPGPESTSRPLPASAPPAVPGSVTQPQTVPTVPAHMHLLCDVLPCPVKQQHIKVTTKDSQSADDSQTVVVHKKTQVNTYTDEPIGERVPSPPFSPSGTIEGEGPSSRYQITERNAKVKVWTKELKKSEKKTATSLRKHQKTPRYTLDREHACGPGPTDRISSLRKVPQKVKQRAEQQQQEGSQEFTGPPPSPVHSALGQVVSEVLFPSPVQRNPVSAFSPTTPLPSSPPRDAQRSSTEVVSQLLQEAQDSDGKEFEDDPLLQVLRKQRKWVKEQIGEVDSMLEKFLDEQEHIVTLERST